MTTKTEGTQLQLDFFPVNQAPPPSKGPSWSDNLGTEVTPEVIAKVVAEVTERDAALKALPPVDIYGFGPWSPSKLKTLQKCQFQFYLKYILKLKIPESLISRDDPISSEVGKAAHQILEYVMLGKTVEKAYAVTKSSYLLAGTLTEAQWVEHVESLHYNITTFKDRIDDFGRQHKIKRVFTELRVAVDRNYAATGFFAEDVWLRGIVDLIIQLDNGDLVIIDHKTGGGEGSVKVYAFQLDWYKVLFHYGIEPIGGAQTAVHFIRAGDMKMADYSTVKQIEGNLKNTLEMALEGSIDNLKDKGFFKHVRGNYCKWCEYDGTGCKSGELKPIELGTKKWFRIIAEPKV